MLVFEVLAHVDVASIQSDILLPRPLLASTSGHLLVPVVFGLVVGNVSWKLFKAAQAVRILNNWRSGPQHEIGHSRLDFSFISVSMGSRVFVFLG